MGLRLRSSLRRGKGAVDYPTKASRASDDFIATAFTPGKSSIWLASSASSRKFRPSVSSVSPSPDDPGPHLATSVAQGIEHRPQRREGRLVGHRHLDHELGHAGEAVEKLDPLDTDRGASSPGRRSSSTVMSAQSPSLAAFSKSAATRSSKHVARNCPSHRRAAPSCSACPAPKSASGHPRPAPPWSRRSAHRHRG